MAYRPSNPSQGVFSPSSIESYLTCPRKFYLSYLKRLESNVKAPALTFGSAIHAGLATYFKTGKDKVLAIQAFTKYFEENTRESDQVRNLQTGLITLHNYFNEYGQDTTPIDPTAIEINFDIQMPNGTTLIGVIDALIRDGKQLLIQDHKTTATKALSDYYFRAFENDFQTSSYCYAAIQLVGDCDGIQIDAIKVPGEKSEHFQRRTFIRTDLQQAEWLNTYLKTTNQIMDAIKTSEAERLYHFYQNQGSCANYGGCSFLPLCQHGLDHPALQAEFVIKESVE